MTIKTISQLEAEGYTHIECGCDQCRVTVQMPFMMIRKRRPLLSAMTFDELGGKMRCERCGARPSSFKPWRQSDEPGYVSAFPRGLQ